MISVYRKEDYISPILFYTEQTDHTVSYTE